RSSNPATIRSNSPAFVTRAVVGKCLVDAPLLVEDTGQGKVQASGVRDGKPAARQQRLDPSDFCAEKLVPAVHRQGTQAVVGENQIGIEALGFSIARDGLVHLALFGAGNLQALVR